MKPVLRSSDPSASGKRTDTPQVVGRSRAEEILSALRALIGEEIGERLREEMQKQLAARPEATESREYVDIDEILHMYSVGRTWFFAQLADEKSGLAACTRRPRGTTRRLVNLKEFREWFVRQGSVSGSRKRRRRRDGASEP